MNDSTNDDKPINDDLERLAKAAETEDKPKEEESNEVQTVSDQHDIDRRTAQNAASTIINGLAHGVKLLTNVEYQDETKARGIEVLAPCLQSEDGEGSSWVINALGNKWLAFGGFVVGTTLMTFAVIQQRKEEEAKKEANNQVKAGDAPESQPIDPYKTTQPATSGGFSSMGE